MSRKVNLFFASALVVMAATNTTPLGNVYAQESTYGPVKPGELIWNIAGKVTPNASVSRQQVIIGILHANPSAFKVPCNFNSLKGGGELIIPALTDIQALSQEEAKKEFDGQNEAWKNRKKNPIVCPTPGVAPPVAPPTAATTSPTTPPSPTRAEVTPPKETPPAVTPKPSDSPKGAQISPPAPTSPLTAPAAPLVTVAPKPAATVTAPAAVSPPPSPLEAPKPVTENAASPPPAAPTNATLPAPASPAGTTAPPSSSSPKTPPSKLPDLIIWILIGGGLLSAFIIAGLLHVHARNEASVPPDPNKYDFAEKTKRASDDAVDDMPLHTDQDEEKRSMDIVKE